MSYDFMTLSPEDFENLVRDALSAEWGGQVEAFKSGRDSGIDLRFSGGLQQDSKTIVQCKRYAPEKFSALLQVAKDELPKIEKLKPNRYVLVTSVGLNPDNKNKLLEVLKPWCQSTADIISPAELNGMLNRHPEVVKAHFKLWISSTAALERILHAGVFNVTEDTVQALKGQMCKLVMHGGFKRALEILHEYHHVLILGNPGIGKTTLARMLMCHYLEEGFKPVIVVGNISDAWETVTSELKGNGKAVVFYDDFLGEIRFDESKFGKNEEKSLVQFLAKVQATPNLRFILTTREYILADAERLHGAFQRHAGDLAKCTLSLGDFSDSHRARILFNHLYFSDLPQSRLIKLVEKKVYKTIISHRHFNPRIVEGISKFANSKSLTDDDYLKYIEKEFDDPSGVWNHPFVHQISPTSRQLLLILWSFGGVISLNVLEQALKAFNQEDAPEEVVLRMRDSLKELDGNFILTDSYKFAYSKTETQKVVKFQNPSVEEYVENFVESELVWAERLAEAAICFRQVNNMLVWAAGGGYWYKQKISKQLSPGFWQSLWRAAERTEHIEAGRLVHYYGDQKPSFDPKDGMSELDKTLVILRVSAKAGGSSVRVSSAIDLINSVDGWAEFLRPVPDDESEPYAVLQMLRWIKEDSGWSDELVQSCCNSYRGALKNLLQSEEIWSASIGSLEVLTETFETMKCEPTGEEALAFEQALKITYRTVNDNIDDAEALESEISSLKKVSKFCAFDSTAEESSLAFKLETLREDEQEASDGTHENSKYQSGGTKNDDVDALFATLLNR